MVPEPNIQLIQILEKTVSSGQSVWLYFKNSQYGMVTTPLIFWFTNAFSNCHSPFLQQKRMNWKQPKIILNKLQGQIW